MDEKALEEHVGVVQHISVDPFPRCPSEPRNTSHLHIQIAQNQAGRNLEILGKNAELSMKILFCIGIDIRRMPVHTPISSDP
jgi:hypothetical protein